MPKLTPARLDGLYGMEKFTAEELYAKADVYEMQIDDPENTDDPKWLKRWVNRIRKLAEQKERAREHKSTMRRKNQNYERDKSIT